MRHHANSPSEGSLRTAYLAWASIAFFFFYVYILRVAPGVMINDLRSAFHLTAEQFSTLGSYYLYAYSLIQIPLGILVDRIGVRKSVVSSIIICIAGALLLGTTHNFLLAQVSRILVGLGSASAFMCALKVVADRLPPGSRGFLMGATLTLGPIGAICTGKPLVWALDSFGWRASVIGTAILGLVILAAALAFLPKRAPNRPKLAETQASKVTHEIWGVVKNSRIMLYALLAVGLYTPLSALADLWGTSFLMQKFELNRANAAQTTMVIYIGMASGSLLLPWLSEKYNVLNRSIQICGFGMLFTFAFILYGPMMSIGTLSITMFTLGIFCGAEMMCFTGALTFSNKDNSGLVIGVVNTLNMLGGAILQQSIGFGLDFQWKKLQLLDLNGLRLYTTPQYIRSLSMLLVVVTFCCVASLWLRKKKMKKNDYNL